MRVDGIKWANGTYKLNRIIVYDGSWNIVDTITITINNKDIICKDSNTQDIRTIEFRTKKKFSYGLTVLDSDYYIN